MKKIISTTILSMFCALIMAGPALAATNMTLSPTNVNVRAGQSFNISVMVNPQGTTDYAERLVLNYPSDLLQVNSFTTAGTWIPLTQAGYDSVDNVNGTLIKTAGYPGGFSSATTFGTISFHAKKAGSGIIMVGNNSIAFQVNSQSTPIGNNVTFAVTTATRNTTPAQVQTSTTTTTVTTEVPAEQVSQSAAVVNSVPASTGSSTTMWAWIIGIIVVILLIVTGLYYAQKNRE